MDQNVALGSVISFPHVSATYKSQSKTLVQGNSDCTAQAQKISWLIWRATSLFRCYASIQLLERLLLLHRKPIVDPQLPEHQAVFDTVAWLFNRWLINRRHWGLFRGQGESWSGADLTAAYNSVRHQGLSLELLCIIPDRQMAQFIVNILSNCSFKVKTRNGKCSHLWCLQNGLPQGSLLAPLLFTIYISEILSTRSCQYRYADDLALLYTNKSREELEKTLSTDMCVIAEDPACYRKLSVTKTTSTTFHLNIKETKCQLAVNVWGNTLPYNSNHSLWVKLDRQLTYKSRAYVRE